MAVVSVARRRKTQPTNRSFRPLPLTTVRGNLQLAVTQYVRVLHQLMVVENIRVLELSTGTPSTNFSTVRTGHGRRTCWKVGTADGRLLLYKQEATDFVHHQHVVWHSLPLPSALTPHDQSCGQTLFTGGHELKFVQKHLEHRQRAKSFAKF